MKTFLTRWLSFIFFFTNFPIFANKIQDNSYILEVKKDSGIFESPSSKSKVLAQADKGTYLIFLEKSKKGLWLKVQDSGGLSGWIPSNRTDYEEIEKLNKQGIDSFLENEKVTKDNDEIKNNFYDKERNYRLSPLYRKASYSVESQSLLGLRFDWKLPSGPFLGEPRKSYLISVEAVTPYDLQKISMEFGGAIRLGMQIPFYKWLFYVPDYGYSFEKHKGQLHHHFAIGLSGGVDMGRLDLRARIGYNFFSQSYASMEVQLGCWF